MPSSNSEARARLALLALLSLPAWACATAIDNAPADSSPLASSGDSGNPSAGSSGSASAGAGSSAGKAGATGAAGSGASGAPQSGGAPGSAGNGGAGKGGTSSGGSGSAGKGGTSSGGSGSAGKGGTAGSSTGAAGKGGSSSAGSSSAGSSSAGASSAGTSAGGASSGGTTGGTGCDAAHAVATITTQQVYTGKANDCVRLAVNPTWAMIALKFQPMPGTAAYPVPFSFSSCAGNGTGSLTGDYVENTFKTGTNPGCDFFVQFGGGATTIKVTYYD